MNTIQQKIAKTGKTASTVLRITWILTIIGAISLTIGLGIILFAPAPLSISLQNAFTITTSAGVSATPNTRNLIVAFIIAFIQLAVAFIILYTLYLIFMDISRDYSPFEKKQVTRLRRVAIFTLVMCVISNVFEALASLLLFESGSWEFNFTGILIALIIFCMAHIFDYGYQLQMQSNETL